MALRLSILRLLPATGVLLAGLWAGTGAWGQASSCGPAPESYTLNWIDQESAWPATSLSETLTVPNNPGNASLAVTVTVSGDTGDLIRNTPNVTNYNRGGLPPSMRAFELNADFEDDTEWVTATFDFSRTVSDLRFDIFDIDRSSFRDSVEIIGLTPGGTPVIPDLRTPFHTTGTNPNSTVHLDGPLATGPGQAYGDLGSAPQPSDEGTLEVSFSQDVTAVTIRWGSFLQPPSSNPGDQGISIHDMTFCAARPRGPQARLEATKTQVVFSETPAGCATFPGTPDPQAAFHIPGACIAYTISVTNTGAGDARDLEISDTLDTRLVFQAGRITGFVPDGSGFGLSTPPPGTPCAAGACPITLTQARLNSGTTGTIEIRALIQ